MESAGGSGISMGFVGRFGSGAVEYDSAEGVAGDGAGAVVWVAARGKHL